MVYKVNGLIKSLFPYTLYLYTRNRILRFLSLLLFFFSPLISAQEERVVAEIGSRKIYESEFKERFDFSVHPKLLQKSDRLKAKEEFLNQLIAEKLLSLEAAEKGFDTLEVFQDLIIPLENIFTRDALYTSEVKNKITYTQNDIDEGLRRINKALMLKFIFSKDEDEIEKIYSLLQRGSSFDSLLSQRHESNDEKMPREITFGTMEKPVEDAVYNLKTGQFTPPLESKDGYYILKLTGVEANSKMNNLESARDEVKRIVQARAEFKRYIEYHRDLFSREKVTADKEIFDELSSAFVKKFKEKYALQTKEYKDKFFLLGNDLISASESVRDRFLNKPFIKIKDSVYLKSFLNQLSQEGFYVQDTTGISIRSSLSSYIRKFIEDQILTAEGKKNGFDNSADVKKYTGMWKDYYLSGMMMMNLFDSIKVGDQEAYSLFKMNNDLTTHLSLVNIAEVLTDSLAVVEQVLNGIAEGKNIKDLARKFTKRDSLREKGGEFGFFPVTKYGELGKTASRMSIGEVYGPLKTDEGYSVFQLLGRKEDTTVSKMNYEDIKDQIMTLLTQEKFEKFVNEHDAMLAQKYGVKIYDGVLKDIEDSYLNLIVVRYMGFGGEIYAVPLTEEYPGWYEIWKEKQKINP